MSKKVMVRQHSRNARERVMAPMSIECQSTRTRRRAEMRKAARAERKARIRAARERGLVRFAF